jgi:hypothetical protein
MIIRPNRPRYTIDRSDPEPHRRHHNKFGRKLEMRPDLLSEHANRGAMPAQLHNGGTFSIKRTNPAKLSMRPRAIGLGGSHHFLPREGTPLFARRCIECLCSIRGPRPDELDAFVERLVPELQRCRIFRREHEGATFYEHLDLSRPANRFHPMEASRQPAAEQWGGGACRWVGLRVAPQRGSKLKLRAD